MRVRKTLFALLAGGLLAAAAPAIAADVPPPPVKPESPWARATASPPPVKPDPLLADAGESRGGFADTVDADAEIIPLDVEDVAPEALRQRAAEAVPRGVMSVTLGKTRPLRLGAEVADVIVGDPGVAEILVGTRQRVYVAGRGIGATNIFFLDEAGEVIRQAEVVVEVDTQAVRRALGRLLPDEEITVGVVNGSVVLSGTVRSAEVAERAVTIAGQFVPGERILNMMTQAGEQQVMLRVRVAEVSRNISKQLSGEASYDFDIGSTNIDLNNLGDLAPLGLASAGQIAISGPGPFSFILQALEQEDLVSILAEPNLTAISGEAASMLAGGEIPVPTSISDGEIAYEWRPFGVTLSFQPVVLGPGRISLNMNVEVSAIAGSRSFGALDVPEFTVRRATSTVEMPSGGSVMIGGLLREDMRQAVEGFPGLKNLPVLGALFRSSGFISNETELVFTVTAYIVRPVESRALALPTDGFVPAGDLDRYLLGKLTASYSDVSLDDFAGGMPVRGPIGYIVE